MKNNITHSSNQPRSGQPAQPTFIPLAKPNPPRLSEHVRELMEIEASNTFSNFGPVNERFERDLQRRVFGKGHCLTVCNATTGLMVAIRQVTAHIPLGTKRYALMPSFTFAATAHAALWNGLTPLLCDIDPKTWLPSPTAEEDLLDRYGDQISVIIPYATFGNNLDLDRYRHLSNLFEVPIVVDAAASLGSANAQGKAFGCDFEWPVVFSMHATKSFATGEGGVIYCADEGRLEQMRAMCSFGFETPRTATLPGLNGKLTEVAALTALLQLDRLSEVAEHRHALHKLYRRYLPDWTYQQTCGQRQSFAFESILLPSILEPHRSEVINRLREAGVGASTNFSPHLAQHPYFAKIAVSGMLPVTEDVARRILTLPMFDTMTETDVQYVCLQLTRIANDLTCKVRERASQKQLVSCPGFTETVTKHFPATI